MPRVEGSETILGDYLDGVTEVWVEEPYIRVAHQIQNFVRFCETLAKRPTVKKIHVLTACDEATAVSEVLPKLEDLKQSLLEIDIALEIAFDPKLHDREIRLDSGWVIKIGRGLDFYQKPNSWFELGVNDLSLRKCLETKVDIFKQQ